MLPVARTAVLVLGCCVAAARGQEDDGVLPAASELARVQRDQSRIGVRIAGLREKMERLAQRYESEGRTRNATLLREALVEFDAKQVQDVARELERNLSQSNLSSVEQQDGLVVALEQVYAVLRDRRDADELQRQADLARKAVDELGFLAKNERRLLGRTRAATDQPGSLLQKALELAARLQQSLTTAGGATQSTEAAEQALGDSALAETLLAEQRALAQDPAATAGMQALLEEGLALLRERIEKPLAGQESGAEAAPIGDELLAAAEAARGEAREAAALAAAAMRAAREGLERGASGKPAAPMTRPAGSAAGKPPAEAAGAESGAAAGEAPGETPSEGAPPATPGAEETEPSGGAPPAGDGKPSNEATSASAPKPSGATPSGTTPSGATPSGTTPSGATPSGATPSGATPSGAKPSGATPPADAEPAETGEPSAEPGQPSAEARQAMEEATEALEELRDALEASERSLNAARNRARALALASSAEAEQQAGGLEDLAERLEAVEPDAGQELLDRTRQLLEDLQKSAAAIEQGENASASAAQREARTSLDELIRQLQARAGETPDSTPRTPDPAELAALADQQQELQRQVAELMARLEELPDQQFRQAGARAGEAMEAAQSALREGRTEEAAVREEEAAEQLEQARKKLAGERDRYEQLRQEEVLFRVGEELKSLLEKHDAIAAETLELDAGRGDEERLGRSQRRTATRLASQEKDLSVQCEALRAALEKDGAVAFSFALERCRDDLVSAAELLADEQTGYLVQSVQGDVHQRLADLLAVLESERERRRNAPTEPAAPGQQQQKKTPLVPTVAELLLIQRMEQAALARLDSFQRNTPGLDEPGGVDPVERELIERWALEHTAVTELFRRMIPQDGGAARPDENFETSPEPGEEDER